MENKLKEHINKSLKKSILKEDKYDEWLKKVLFQDTRDVYFPAHRDEEELFQLLALEVLYKRTLKSACDEEHPVVKELLQDLNIDKKLMIDCIEKIKSFKSEPLDFYLLFQEELGNANLRMDCVCEMVDKISKDSLHGAVVSHPAKMSNPECKFPKIVASSIPSSDGFLRTGNYKEVFDMHINAKNLKVFKFLSLLYEEKPLLEYIKTKNWRVFEKLFKVNEERAKVWIENFSRCLSNQSVNTNQYIKQVYFPVGNEYHLLSLLTPSGLIFSLKEKIDNINYKSPNAYLGKKLKKENKYFENKFSCITDLTMTCHGGKHPKNISGLNNKYQSYYVLNSSPPKLEKRNIRFPIKNFFNESLRNCDYLDIFYSLHKIFKTNYSNAHIREGRDYHLQGLIDCIIDKMWAVRAVADQQYRPIHSRLELHQRIWLCEEYWQTREEENIWLDKLCEEITNWIILTYEKLLSKQAIKMGESERQHIYNLVAENKDALR